MIRSLGIKLLRLIPVLFFVSLGTFLLIELVPGDPVAAVIGETATDAEIDAARARLGLDQPLFERYVDWLGDALTGDLGTQIKPPNEPVADLIQSRFGVTMKLAGFALGISLFLAIPLGILSAYRAGRPLDRGISGLMFGLVSIPSFLAALLLIFLFVFNAEIPQWTWFSVGLVGSAALLYLGVRAYLDDHSDRLWLWFAGAGVAALGLTVWVTVQWPTFPRLSDIGTRGSISEQLSALFLPALALAATEIAVFTRLLRGDMMSTLQEQYILSARAKGMPTSHILMRDALRPSSFSLITLAGIVLGRLIGGTVIIETIFGINGIGSLIVVNGVIPKDYPVVQGGVLVVATVYVLLNVTIDLSYQYLDPRIRRG